MSGDWHGHWFTADLSNGNSLLSNLPKEAGSQETSKIPLTPVDALAGNLASHQYDHERPVHTSQTKHLPMQEDALLDATEYDAAQQASQDLPPSVRSSPRLTHLPRTSTDQPQSATSAASAFPLLPPSQKLATEHKSSSRSAHSSQTPAKRGRPDTNHQETIKSPKRRPSGKAASIPTQISTEKSRLALNLTEEERLLVQLKEDQNLPWKAIAKEFENKFGRPFHVPALQMRLKRLRERLRRWTNQDIAALEAAHDYWESNKFEIIANKMLDFGVQERWPARYCERKWEKLHADVGRTRAVVAAERTKSPRVLPIRFDTDIQNYSMDWPIPSPPREDVVSQATSPS